MLNPRVSCILRSLVEFWTSSICSFHCPSPSWTFPVVYTSLFLPLHYIFRFSEVQRSSHVMLLVCTAPNNVQLILYSHHLGWDVFVISIYTLSRISLFQYLNETDINVYYATGAHTLPVQSRFFVSDASLCSMHENVIASENALQ